MRKIGLTIAAFCAITQNIHTECHSAGSFLCALWEKERMRLCIWKMLRKEGVLVIPKYREKMVGVNLPAEYKEAVLEQ